MKAKEFLIEKLRLFYASIEDIQIRYEYRNSTKSHLIEILPISLFEENEHYMEMEADLEEEFEQLYPTENIVFISEGSITEIQEPDFVVGYDVVRFYNDFISFEIEIAGFNDIVETAGENNYALAA